MNMKGKNILITLTLGIVLMLALPLVSQQASAEAQLQVTFSFFHEKLTPYGYWEETSAFGPVWRPTNMPVGWQPYYSDGHWVYTDYGWTWVSDQPWGDIAYHYGTWYRDSYGWAWVPGYTWGPAWVTWQYTKNHVGWAPLPPTFSFHLGFGRNRDYYYEDYPSYYYYAGQPVVVHNNYYVFVPAQHITSINLSFVRMPVHRNYELMRGSRSITTYTVVNNYIVNPGPRLAVFDPIRRNRQRIKVVMQDARVQPQTIQVTREHRRIEVISPTITRKEARNVLTQAEIKAVRERRRLEREQEQQKIYEQQEQRRLERQQQEQRIDLQKEQRRLERQQQKQIEQQEKEQRRLERRQKRQQERQQLP